MERLLRHLYGAEEQGHLPLGVRSGRRQTGPARTGRPEVVNPSFLAIHPTRSLLYAAGEIGDFGGRKAGVVGAMAIQAGSGKLTLLNQQPSQGPGPCHVSVDRSGRFVLVANYSGGSIACLPIQSYGRLARRPRWFSITAAAQTGSGRRVPTPTRSSPTPRAISSSCPIWVWTRS